MRVSQSMLDNAIQRLNSQTKGHFIQNNAYGYSQLALKHINSAGGIHAISNGNTKSELYYQIIFFLDVMEKESDSKNWVENCTHRDLFNTMNHNAVDLPRDRSVVRQYDLGYYCGGCDSKVTKKDFIKSQKPITDKQMRRIK